MPSLKNNRVKLEGSWYFKLPRIHNLQLHAMPIEQCPARWELDLLQHCFTTFTNNYT